MFQREMRGLISFILKSGWSFPYTIHHLTVLTLGKVLSEEMSTELLKLLLHCQWSQT